MTAAHGADYFNVKPSGSLGDSGCDGYLKSTGQVFQCYGAVGGEKKQVSTLISKINSDYKKASSALSDIMTGWSIVHNLVDGMPVQAVQTLMALTKNNPTVKIEQIGLEALADRIFKLPTTQIELLLGPRSENFETRNVDINVIRNMVSGLAFQFEETPTITIDLRPVPPEKLNMNNLPNHWKHLIASGWQGTAMVGQYFAKHPDPTLGDSVANVFRARYDALKMQGLEPSAIMSSLLELITGVGHVLPSQHHSAVVLLAFLFENCDIFERPST